MVLVIGAALLIAGSLAHIGEVFMFGLVMCFLGIAIEPKRTG
jgi:hypothetical protein